MLPKLRGKHDGDSDSGNTGRNHHDPVAPVDAYDTEK